LNEGRNKWVKAWVTNNNNMSSCCLFFSSELSLLWWWKIHDFSTPIDVDNDNVVVVGSFMSLHIVVEVVGGNSSRIVSAACNANNTMINSRKRREMEDQMRIDESVVVVVVVEECLLLLLWWWGVFFEWLLSSSFGCGPIVRMVAVDLSWLVLVDAPAMWITVVVLVGDVGNVWRCLAEEECGVNRGCSKCWGEVEVEGKHCVVMLWLAQGGTTWWLWWSLWYIWWSGSWVAGRQLLTKNAFCQVIGEYSLAMTEFFYGGLSWREVELCTPVLPRAFLIWVFLLQGSFLLQLIKIVINIGIHACTNLWFYPRFQSYDDSS